LNHRVYYVAPQTPMMSSVISDYSDLAPPNILRKYAPMVSTDVDSHI